MKRLAGIVGLLVLLPACGKNPLLTIQSSDYTPSAVGSHWEYVDAAGARAFENTISSAGAYQGRNVYWVTTTAPLLPPVSIAKVNTGATLEVYSSTFGWTVDRKLPLITGNSWPMPSNVANQSYKRYVEEDETVVTPAGTFKLCYKLRTEKTVYNPVSGLSTTSGTYIWAAPNVGDVKGADYNSSGVVTVKYLLSSYSLGPS